MASYSKDRDVGGWADINLHTPHTFRDEHLLEKSEVHFLETAGEIKDTINHDAVVWLNKVTAYAILSNTSVFAMPIDNDIVLRKHGSCYLVNTNRYSSSIGVGHGYDGCMVEDSFTKEMLVGYYELGDDVRINVFEIKGALWVRRRFVLASDNTYSLIQWKKTSSHVPVVNPMTLEIASFAADTMAIASQLSLLTYEVALVENIVHPLVTEEVLYEDLNEGKNVLSLLKPIISQMELSLEEAKANYCVMAPTDCEMANGCCASPMSS